MIKSILILLLTASVARAETLNKNWRVNGFLWKPVAEHYAGLVVVTLPRGTVSSVGIYQLSGRKIEALRFRSRGDAGDAWADYNHPGLFFRRQYGSVVVRVFGYNGKVKNYLIKRPGRRSDEQ